MPSSEKCKRKCRRFSKRNVFGLWIKLRDWCNNIFGVASLIFNTENFNKLAWLSVLTTWASAARNSRIQNNLLTDFQRAFTIYFLNNSSGVRAGDVRHGNIAGVFFILS